MAFSTVWQELYTLNRVILDPSFADAHPELVEQNTTLYWETRYEAKMGIVAVQVRTCTGQTWTTTESHVVADSNAAYEKAHELYVEQRSAHEAFERQVIDVEVADQMAANVDDLVATA